MCVEAALAYWGAGDVLPSAPGGIAFRLNQPRARAPQGSGSRSARIGTSTESIMSTDGNRRDVRQSRHPAALSVLAGIFIVGAVAGAAHARDAFHEYGASYRAIALPPIGDGSFGIKGDCLPDGRIIAVTGNTIYLERGLRTGQFDPVAALDATHTGGATDPAFLRVSPNGATIAIGAGFGKPVVVFPAAALGSPGAPTVLTDSVAGYFEVSHYDAAWRDNTHLAITSGDFGSPSIVSFLDTTSSPAAPVNPTVIQSIGGSPGGIAFDSNGYLYTGVGFDTDPFDQSRTGTVRAFLAGDLDHGPLVFDTFGRNIGEFLSADTLDFDAEGNLFVGGGDPPSDAGYLGLVSRGGIVSGLAGMPVDTDLPEYYRRLDPRGDGMGYYGAAFNDATGELLIADGATWYATIPSPGAGVLVIACGALVTRRRRNA
jgi:hypothetical protein